MKKAKAKIKENPISERVGNYVKHKNGAIFLMTEDTSSDQRLYLISKMNRYHSKQKKDIAQGLVNGEWKEVNEHEVRKWEKDYETNVLRITQKLLRHVIMAELLVSADADLEQEGIQDKYFNSLLNKGCKQAMRIADKHIDNLYEKDNVTLQNIMSKIETLVKNISKLPLEDYAYFEKYTQEYFKDPKKFRDLEVEFVKPE